MSLLSALINLISINSKKEIFVIPNFWMGYLFVYCLFLWHFDWCVIISARTHYTTFMG